MGSLVLSRTFKKIPLPKGITQRRTVGNGSRFEWLERGNSGADLDIVCPNSQYDAQR